MGLGKTLNSIVLSQLVPMDNGLLTVFNGKVLMKSLTVLT